MGNQQLGSFELADDLLVYVPSAFHGGVPNPVWPDEDSHSPGPISGGRVTPIGRHRIARLMERDGLRAKTHQAFRTCSQASGATGVDNNLLE